MSLKPFLSEKDFYKALAEAQKKTVCLKNSRKGTPQFRCTKNLHEPIDIVEQHQKNAAQYAIPQSTLQAIIGSKTFDLSSPSDFATRKAFLHQNTISAQEFLQQFKNQIPSKSHQDVIEKWDSDMIQSIEKASVSYPKHTSDVGCIARFLNLKELLEMLSEHDTPPENDDEKLYKEVLMDQMAANSHHLYSSCLKVFNQEAVPFNLLDCFLCLDDGYCLLLPGHYPPINDMSGESFPFWNAYGKIAKCKKTLSVIAPDTVDLVPALLGMMISGLAQHLSDPLSFCRASMLASLYLPHMLDHVFIETHEDCCSAMPFFRNTRFCCPVHHLVYTTEQESLIRSLIDTPDAETADVSQLLQTWSKTLLVPILQPFMDQMKKLFLQSQSDQ